MMVVIILELVELSRDDLESEVMLLYLNTQTHFALVVCHM
jgi:hypothetical protein